jgi:hypothetical protein
VLWGRHNVQRNDSQHILGLFATLGINDTQHDIQHSDTQYLVFGVVMLSVVAPLWVPGFFHNPELIIVEAEDC